MYADVFAIKRKKYSKQISKLNKLKTKQLTKVCMTITIGICKCWKFFRTATPFRNVQDFDFHVRDLRCQYSNSLSYQHFKKKNPKWFDKRRFENEEQDTVINHIRMGDCLLTYSFENYLRSNSVPPCCREKTSTIVWRELIGKTLKSHRPASVIDFEDKVKERKAGYNETRPSK